MVTDMNDSGSDDYADGESNADVSIRHGLTAWQALRDQRWLRAFAAHLWQHFRADRSFEAAGALSFTSLLALVPLMNSRTTSSPISCRRRVSRFASICTSLSSAPPV
jgi:hypothetical protein